MASSHSAGVDCNTFGPTYSWDWGLGGGSAWVQYGDKGAGKQDVSFMRSPAREALKIYFHDASKAVRPTDEIPGFATFSFESGTGASVVAVDGVGILQKFQGGLVGFSSGNLDYPDDALRHFSRVNRRARGKFRIYISDTCYDIPLSQAARVALRIVFSPQPEFNKLALRLNDVRDKKMSVEEFSKL